MLNSDSLAEQVPAVDCESSNFWRGHRRNTPALFLAAAVFFGLISTAKANDSSAVLAAGGLILSQSEQISMAAEDLSISEQLIEIHYTFRNNSDQTIHSLVTFPLPRIDLAEMANTPIDIPSTDPVNFMDFKVEVAGKPIATQVQERALLNGIDVTDQLKQAGLPVSSLSGQFYQTLGGLPKDTLKTLIAAGLVEGEIDEPDTLLPRWTSDIQFYWPMVFPPNADVEVTHLYKPVVGSQFVHTARIDGGKDDDLTQPYCIDAGTRRAMLKAYPKPSAQDEMPLRTAKFIDYILLTATNWRGPIGRFHLTIDKGQSDSILSLCFDGLKKTAPTRFEFTALDYVPKADLKMMILK